MELLVRLFVKEYRNVKDPGVRTQYGRLSGALGIMLNSILFIGKFVVGTISGSVSITADAVNNLSDAGSSVLALIGFKLAEKPADDEHPFGHARIEYVSSMIVALLILMLGVDLLKESVKGLFVPEMPAFSLNIVLILGASILVKVWMFCFNRRMGRRIDSGLMQATAADSLSDCLSTGAVLLSTIVSPMIGYSLDSVMGILVALLILRSAVQILKEALGKLLGEAPEKETEQLLRTHLVSQENVLGVHDLVVHSYGPGRMFASAHVEVDASENLLSLHEMIDNIERDVREEHHIDLVIHMDPVVIDDPLTNRLREETRQLLLDLDEALTMHDFRMVKGETHSNLIFDVLVPRGIKMKDEELKRQIADKVKTLGKNYYAVITLDRSYLGK